MVQRKAGSLSDLQSSFLNSYIKINVQNDTIYYVCLMPPQVNHLRVEPREVNYSLCQVDTTLKSVLTASCPPHQHLSHVYRLNPFTALTS